MKVLLTGATGYIGQRLITKLLDDGHNVIAAVRDEKRFVTPYANHENISTVEVDFLEEKSLNNLPQDIDAAYYLIHSMSGSSNDFKSLEERAAGNFVKSFDGSSLKQVIYLSGIVNDKELSKHLDSRKSVEKILTKASFSLTTLRAGIIVGSGSASFEIIRDLVEKLPVMVAPKWLKTKTQPIGVRNVIQFLVGVLGSKEFYGSSYDIGGPEVMSYRQMLMQYAEERKLKRSILTVPVLTPKLSSYWLYFVTSTSYNLAKHLVNSMTVEVIGNKNDLHEKLNIDLLTYREAIQLAFDKIKQQYVLSHWTDAQSSDILNEGVDKVVEVPQYGCFKDVQKVQLKEHKNAFQNIWQIGGKRGWYYGNWLWEIRGFLDKIVGGVGLRRGRKSQKEIQVGESLDFWRVIYASKEKQRLLLYAEMKVPGEAWLEFRIEKGQLIQSATFRPLGIMGRMYWYLSWPFHLFIFSGMAKKIANK